MFVDRNKKISKYAKGMVLDVGYGAGNIYLRNAVGIDIEKQKNLATIKKFL